MAGEQLSGRALSPGIRLLALLWVAFWLWLTTFQVQRGGWGWALLNIVLLAIGVWCYAEMVIEDVKSRAAIADQKSK